MEKDKSAYSGLASSGIDSLINRLRDEGVQSGREEAAQIKKEAELNAQAIIQSAEQRATEILENAREEADILINAGKEALRIAMRDNVLEMKSHLSQRFSEEIKRLVAAALHKEDFLEKMILEIVRSVHPEQDPIEVILPRNIVCLDELREHPEELREGSLSHFVLSISGKILNEGVVFKQSDEDQTGIRISLHDGEIQVDLTVDAITEVLLDHLHPRFRAILEGSVK